MNLSREIGLYDKKCDYYLYCSLIIKVKGLLICWSSSTLFLIDLDDRLNLQKVQSLAPPMN